MLIKERIIVSSTNLFVRSGIKSVTMDDISSSMGISKRTIYENFANKRALLIGCIRYQQLKQENEEKEIAANSASVFDELFLIFEKIDEKFKQQGKFIDEVKRFYPEIFEAEFGTHYDKSAKRLNSKISKGIEQGLIIPDTNVDFAAFVVLETLYSVLSRPEIVSVKKISMVDASKYVITFFFRGISTEKGIKLIDELIANKNK